MSEYVPTTEHVINRLKEIQDRADAATEGPWSSHAFGYSGEGEPSSIVVHHDKFNWQAVRDGEFVASMPRWDAQESDDAEFIAHARADVPRLVEALRRVLDQVTEWRDESFSFFGGPVDEATSVRYECAQEVLAAVEAALGEVAS